MILSLFVNRTGGGTTTYDYDGSGLLSTLRTDPKGLKREYAYGSYGRKIVCNMPASTPSTNSSSLGNHTALPSVAPDPPGVINGKTCPYLYKWNLFHLQIGAKR